MIEILEIDTICKGYVGQVGGGVGTVGKDSSGDNKPDKLPLTNASTSFHDDHDGDAWQGGRNLAKAAGICVSCVGAFWQDIMSMGGRFMGNYF